MSLFSSLNCDDFYHFPLKNRMIWPRLCQTLCLTPPIGKQCDLATRFARWGPLKIWNLKCVLRGHNLLVASRDVVNRLDSHVYKMWSGVHSRFYRSVIRPIIYNIYMIYIPVYTYMIYYYIPYLSPSLMNDGLNCKNTYCTKTVYFMMFGLEMCWAGLKKLPWVPGRPAQRRPVWLHPWFIIYLIFVNFTHEARHNREEEEHIRRSYRNLWLIEWPLHVYCGKQPSRAVMWIKMFCIWDFARLNS